MVVTPVPRASDLGFMLNCIKGKLENAREKLAKLEFMTEDFLKRFWQAKDGKQLNGTQKALCKAWFEMVCEYTESCVLNFMHLLTLPSVNECADFF